MRRFILATIAALGMLFGLSLAAHADHEMADVRWAESTQSVSGNGWMGWGCHDGADGGWAEWEGYVAVAGEVSSPLGPESIQFFGPTEADMPHAPGNTNGYSAQNVDSFAEYGVSHNEITIRVKCVLYAEHEPEPDPEPTSDPEPTDEPTTDPKAEPTDEPKPATSEPAAVPTSVPAGVKTLPDTGVGLPLGLAAAVLLSGGGVLALRRRLSS